jgi:L,D-peptidoglycan transpeptidase YkuD (ErfK/YbiS/YcfS/YnhG family)
VSGWLGSLMAALLLALGNAPDAGRVAATQVVVLDHVQVALPAGGGQVVTVNHTSGNRARVSLWQRTGDSWELVARSRSGHIGYGGLVAPAQRKQATGTTPLGTYDLMWSFGTHPAEPTWRLSHRTIAPGDYWVEDNRSAYYNRYRNKAEGGFRWALPRSRANSSELLTDFPRQYEYSIVMSFNYDAQVRHRGAGIFLHVNGRGATAGCVSAPRWFLRTTLATLDPAQHPVIAIGR